MLFLAFTVIDSLMLYCYFVCGALGDFASAEATGALPLDPAAFEKAGETFAFGAAATVASGSPFFRG